MVYFSLNIRLAVYTLFGKNKIKFGQKFFASTKICTPVHLWAYCSAEAARRPGRNLEQISKPSCM